MQKELKSLSLNEHACFTVLNQISSHCVSGPFVKKTATKVHLTEKCENSQTERLKDTRAPEKTLLLHSLRFGGVVLFRQAGVGGGGGLMGPSMRRLNVQFVVSDLHYLLQVIHLCRRSVTCRITSSRHKIKIK